MKKAFFYLLALITINSSFGQTETAQKIPELVQHVENPRTKVYEKLEENARYKAGDAAWKKYIDSSIVAFAKTNKNKIKKGTYEVGIKFIIHIDGTVSDIKALTNFGNGLEDASIDIIKKSGKWKPGVQNGWEVNSYKTQVLSFVFN